MGLTKRDIEDLIDELKSVADEDTLLIRTLDNLANGLHRLADAIDRKSRVFIAKKAWINPTGFIDGESKNNYTTDLCIILDDILKSERKTGHGLVYILHMKNGQRIFIDDEIANEFEAFIKEDENDTE